MENIIHPCLLNACNFDKTPTLPILLFEAYVFIGTFLIFLLFKGTKHFWQKYLLVFSGVIIFELFTAPMWDNYKLGQYAYIYRDVSWILTMGWSTLVLSTILTVDTLFPKAKEYIRFAWYLIILTVLVVIFESLVVRLGIRSYSPEVMEIVGRDYIPLLNIPWQTLYYVPVFMSLVISFYKYWEFYVTDMPIVPVKKRKWIRSFLLSLTAVLLFELMIESMAKNVNFPAWSYIYHHITIFVTGTWILIIWLSTNIVEKFFYGLNLLLRFAGIVLLSSVFYFMFESYFITHGYRVYGPSAVANFSGFYIPIIHIPIEVVFAIPFYLTLVISFIRYWEIVWDNNL